MRNARSILHNIICIFILYEFCIQFVHIIFMMSTFCRSETKCIQNVCVENVSRILTKFVYILYTKFSCRRSSFNVVYKKFTEVCQNVVYVFHIFCIHQLYTSCTIFVYKMCTQFPCGGYEAQGTKHFCHFGRFFAVLLNKEPKQFKY